MKRIPVGTYLRFDQRRFVDAAAGEVLTLTHRESVRELVEDVARGVVGSILVSAEKMEAPDIRTLQSLRADFPITEIVGVTSDGSVPGVLRLGRAGLSRVIDLRTRESVGLIRCAFLGTADTFERDAVAALLDGVACTPAFVEFVELLFDLNVKPRANTISGRMGLDKNTLGSRFFRAKLPMPKTFVAYARLAWAAHMGESKSLTSAVVSDRLGFGTPQSYGRFIRTYSHMRPSDLYGRFTGLGFVAHMREQLIEPHLSTLSHFDPSRSATISRAPRRGRLALVPEAAA